MDPLGTAINAGLAKQSVDQAQMQMAAQISVQKQAMNFEAGIANALISGATSAQANLLAAEGIGTKVSAVV